MDEKEIALKGGLWTTASTVVTMLSQILRIVILTRFLSKGDFGIVSISTMIIGLCLSFADLGFSSIVMYKHDLNDEEFSSLYWIQFILYGFLSAILVIASPLVARIYSEDQLITVVMVASLNLVFLAIGKLYESVLQKKYEFKSIAIRNIVSNILSLFLAWYLAWGGFGVFSMIISTLFQTLLYNVWSLVVGVHLQKLRFCCHFRKVFPLIKMGLYQTYTRIIDYFSTQLDVMIIGKLLGLEVLGVYDLAKQLVSRFASSIRTIISQVALPIISNNNQNEVGVKTRFLRITKIVAYLCIPVCVITAVFSNDLVRLFYGVKFMDAAPLVAIFSMFAAVTSIGSFFDMLGIAKGRMDLNFKATVYRIVITTPIVLITSMINIEAVAWGQVISSILLFKIYFDLIVNKTYPMSISEYLGQFSKLAFISLPIAIFFYYVYNRMSIVVDLNYWALLCIKIVLFLCVYILSIKMFLWSDVKEQIRLFYRK